MKSARHGNLKLISGTNHPEMAQNLAKALNIKLADVTLGRFSDGEVKVDINENIRGSDLFLLQPTCPPVNDSLMELLVLADAARRASAARITAVMPYFGYARQDRKASPRAPISAKLVANMLTAAGVDRLLTIDLHASQVQGFFDLPVDNLHAGAVLAGYIRQNLSQEPLTVVAPDVGGVARAKSFARRLDAPLAIIDKRRPAPNQAVVETLIGDIKGRTCLLLDDMVDTAGTLCSAAECLQKNGAKTVHAAATHGLLNSPALERIEKSAIETLWLTDTTPKPSKAQSSKIQTISIVPFLAEALRRVAQEESIEELYQDFNVSLLDKARIIA